MHMCIRCDVLEKDEDAVGQTRDYRSGGSAEVQGSANVYLYSMQAFALAIVVHYTATCLRLKAHDNSIRS
jgi:hypothetical protein